MLQFDIWHTAVRYLPQKLFTVKNIPFLGPQSVMNFSIIQKY